MKNTLKKSITKESFVWALTFSFLLLVVVWLNFFFYEDSLPVVAEKTNEVGVSQSSSIVVSEDPIKVEFPYQVIKIDAESIVLKGQKGEMVLPYDPNYVNFFDNTVQENSKLSLSELAIGDYVSVSMIRGSFATLMRANVVNTNVYTKSAIE